MAVDTQAYRVELRPRFPRWYRGWAHFTFSNFLLGGLTAYLATRVHAVRPVEWLAIPVGFLIANAVEYLAHRNPLHRPMPGMRYIYKAHGIQHHRFFTGDAPENMTTSDPHDFAVVLFGPLSQAVLLGGVGLPAALAVWACFGLNPALLFGATASAYFLTYEWLHLIYHLPATHPFTKLPGMRGLRLHHLRHHELQLMTRWNFNITFPIFDAVFGTTYREDRMPVRSPAGSQPQAPAR